MCGGGGGAPVSVCVCGCGISMVHANGLLFKVSLAVYTSA